MTPDLLPDPHASARQALRHAMRDTLGSTTGRRARALFAAVAQRRPRCVEDLTEEERELVWRLVMGCVRSG